MLRLKLVVAKCGYCIQMVTLNLGIYVSFLLICNANKAIISPLSFENTYSVSYTDSKAFHTWAHPVWSPYWHRHMYVFVNMVCTGAHSHIWTPTHMYTHTCAGLLHREGQWLGNGSLGVHFQAASVRIKRILTTWKTGVYHEIWGVWEWSWNNEGWRASGRCDMKQGLRSGCESRLASPCWEATKCLELAGDTDHNCGLGSLPQRCQEKKKKDQCVILHPQRTWSFRISNLFFLESTLVICSC